MANVLYEDFILADVYESALTTALSMNQFITVDESLTHDSGMVKKINRKTAVGDVQDLEMGEGNDVSIEVKTETIPYTVGTTQGRFVYYDEEAMMDDALVEAGLTGVSEKMANDFTAKAVAEWEKASKKVEYTGSIGFDDVVDALAELNFESEDGIFMLIAPSQLAALRKNLKDTLQYSSDFARNGYVGSVAGVNIYISKAVPEDEAIIATKEAVTVFVKKGTEIENERDANIRKNTVYARKVSVTALTDERKVVLLTKKA